MNYMWSVNGSCGFTVDFYDLAKQQYKFILKLLSKKWKHSGKISSCVASQLYMLSIPGSIPAAHTIVGTGCTVL